MNGMTAKEAAPKDNVTPLQVQLLRTRRTSFGACLAHPC